MISKVVQLIKTQSGLPKKKGYYQEGSVKELLHKKLCFIKGSNHSLEEFTEVVNICSLTQLKEMLNCFRKN